MGGYVALESLLRSNPQIAGVVTLGSKIHWSPEIVEKECKLLKPDGIWAKVPQFAAALSEIHGEKVWQTLLNNVAELLSELGANNYLNPQNLAKITAPVKLMLGDRDEMVTLEETILAFKAIPNSYLSILPNCKHPLSKANPSRIAFEIIEFYHELVKG